MKNSLVLFIAAVLFSCNNNSGTDAAKPSASAKTTEAKTDVGSGVSSGNCGKLVVFQKGAIIEGKNYDGNGKEVSSQTTTVTGVKNDNGITVAEADISSTITAGKPPMHIQYKCDGKNLFMDIGAMLSNFSALKGASAVASSLSFPINLSVGEKLPDASLSVAMKRGDIDMKVKTTYKNRMVEGKESVTTSAGTWNCFKISADIVSDVDMGGDKAKSRMAEMLKKSVPVQKSIIWFAPDFGLVRMEMHSGDRLMTRTDITGVKK
ncbi:MAG: hypothetical protein ABI675_24440 [Chitinophagaceae bacterium]